MFGAFRNLASIGSVAATVLLLAGAMAYRAEFQSPPKGAEPYHQRVREAADALPLRIGSWVGSKVPVTPGAVALLNPNIIVSRNYIDLQSNRSVSFLLVHCRDTRDILGHYPPVCYVMHGWTQLSSQPADFQIDDMTLHGKEYEYSRLRLDEVAHVNVFDVMLLPDGRTCGDMETLEQAARDYRGRFFGAAQIQLQCDAGIGAVERREILRTLLQATKPVLEQIRSGLKP